MLALSMPWLHCGAQPAAETQLRERRAAVVAAPEDPQRRHERARALAHAGDHAEALVLYEELVRGFPDNADYLLGLGQIHLWSGRAADSIAPLERALALAPDYADVRLALEQARRAVVETARSRAAERPADAAWAATPSGDERGRPDMFLTASHAQEDPSNHSRNWHDSEVELTARIAPRVQVGLRAVQSSRFGLADSTYGLSGYYPLSSDATVNAEVSWSPTHRVRPRDTWRVALSHALPAGFVLAGGYRQSRYTESDVDVVDVTIERYFSAFRAAYTLYYSDSESAGDAYSHQFHGSWYYRDHASLNLSIAFGDEVEKTLSADAVITTAFQAVALWGESWMTPAFALTYAIGFNDLGTDRGVDFNRKALSFGAKFRF